MDLIDQLRPGREEQDLDFIIRRVRQMRPIGARMVSHCPPPHYPRQIATSYIDFNGQRYTRVEGVGEEAENVIHLEGERGFEDCGRQYCEMFPMSIDA